MKITVYPPEQQGVGEFDGGKFKEQRPIGFPGDSSSISRLGPLFYWAWGKADEPAEIGLHPHKAFEIMTYVIHGNVEHQDSLGTKQTVAAGGVQIMQAGSGIYHAEAFRGEERTEAFQIWFEPNLKQTVSQPPTYHQYHHEQFPLTEREGVIVKTVIGAGAPIHIETDSNLYDISIKSGAQYNFMLNEGRLLSFLVLQGRGSANEIEHFQYKDFVIIQSDSDQEITLQADSAQDLRIVIIEVPGKVDYQLYRK